ncbi:ABC transporter permease [Brevibacterium litoralis]|uniref:ABC transporter permease n=1 Tax=Brevibacterium litoralis TaxID=3138935 RepID=UPI0032EE7B8B
MTAPRNWKMPVLYAVLALLALAVFGFGTPGGEQTVFRFASAGDFFAIPDLTVASRTTALTLSFVLVALAATALVATWQRWETGIWSARVLPIAIGLFFVLSLLTWGASNRGFIDLTYLLAGALALSVPLVFGAMAGVIGERSGIINIAIEGQLLAGAFCAGVVASVMTNPYVGLIAALFGGMAVAVILVFFAVKYWVDQIIIGVVVNVLVVGLTSFLYSTVLTQDSATWNSSQPLPDLPIPVLSGIPVLGPVLFNQTVLVYLMYVIVAVLSVYIFRSRWGLRMRAIGEHPKAADTVGIHVNKWRVINTVAAGAIAGLGGAYLTVGEGLAFGKEMSAGQGYIALAAMILGRWNPVGAMCAALLFGFTKNLGNVFRSIDSPLPDDFLHMLPYIVTVFAVAGFVGRVRPPAAEGKPYAKQ